MTFDNSFKAVLAGLLACLVLVSGAAVLTGGLDAEIDTGTAENPLTALNCGAGDAMSREFYVKVGSAVSIESSVSPNNTTSFDVTGVTPGFGLDFGSDAGGSAWVSGTLSKIGDVNVTITVTYGNQIQDRSAVIHSVDTSATATAERYEHDLTVGTPFSMSVMDYESGHNFRDVVLSSGSLPAGIALDPATGAVSGTPTTVGTSTAVFEVTVFAGEEVNHLQEHVFTVSATPAHTYTVAYDANGGSGSMSPTVGEESPVTLAECTFTAPSGKKFSGWEVDGTVYSPSDSVAVGADSSVTAVAQWTVDVPSVSVPAQSLTLGVPYTMDLGPLFEPLRIVSAEGGQGADALPPGIDVDAFGKITGTPTTAGTYDSVLILEFWEVSDRSYAYTVPFTVSASSAHTYTVVYDANGGSGTMPPTVGDASPVTLDDCGFSKTGSYFLGWLVGGTTYQPGDAVPVAADSSVTAEAQWRENTVFYTHTISYAANGGTGTTASTAVTDTVSGYSKVTLSGSTFTAPAGKHFSGWKIGNEVYQPGQKIDVAGNATVTATAQWAEDTVGSYTHTVSYTANGGTGTMADILVTDDVPGNTEVPLVSCAFVAPVGKHFSGWKIGNDVYQPGQKIDVAGNATVTAVAQWVEDVAGSYTHTVGYEANGGTGNMNPTVVVNAVNGTTDVYLAGNTFSKDGYAFAGWKIGNEVYQPGDKVLVAGNATVTAVAQWKAADINGDGEDAGAGTSLVHIAVVVLGLAVAVVGLRLHPAILAVGVAVTAFGILHLVGILDLF